MVQVSKFQAFGWSRRGGIASLARGRLNEDAAAARRVAFHSGSFASSMGMMLFSACNWSRVISPRSTRRRSDSRASSFLRARPAHVTSEVSLTCFISIKSFSIVIRFLVFGKVDFPFEGRGQRSPCTVSSPPATRKGARCPAFRSGFASVDKDASQAARVAVKKTRRWPDCERRASGCMSIIPLK